MGGKGTPYSKGRIRVYFRGYSITYIAMSFLVPITLILMFRVILDMMLKLHLNIYFINET